MDFNKLLDLKGINFLFLAAAMFLNLFWSFGAASLVAYLAGAQQAPVDLIQAGIVLLTFLGPFLIGWMIGRMSNDGRGPTYGVYGSVGSVLILVFTALPSGILGMILIVVALAGGLNGGLMALR